MLNFAKPFFIRKSRSTFVSTKQGTMIRTTSIKHYKELKAKGVSVELVTKQTLNK